MIRGDAGAARRDGEIVVKLSQENALTLFAIDGALRSAWAMARLDGRKTGGTEFRQITSAILRRFTYRDRSVRRCNGSLDADRRGARPRR